MAKKNTLKRAFDIGFSFFVLLLILPIFLFLISIVKVSSKGPIFYGSIRVGLHGKKITCWKLRTMVKNADFLLEGLLKEDPKLKAEWEKNYKLKQDVRVTKVGHFLRRTSLDELPQFWNVLKGDLSVVGPRPISFAEVDLFIHNQGGKIFSVRPGLTGLWQTSGRNNLSYNKRIELEKKYLEKQSFIFDLLLILKTIPLMIFPKGAF
ncbi:MAG: sugar transferase [Chlamydiota bacterium]